MADKINNQPPAVRLPQDKIAQVIGNLHLQILMLQEENERLKAAAPAYNKELEN